MSTWRVSSGRPLRGEVGVPGDKSITHRSLLLGALADGVSVVSGALLEGDCLATLGCLRALGVEFDVPTSGGSSAISVRGRGLRGLHASAGPLDCNRSGTTMRLLSGVLAGQRFDSILGGHEQLLQRPMRRVVTPLRLMGAEIQDHDGRAPLQIAGRPLHGIVYASPVASAQVKSAILLAGLTATGETVVQEPAPSRDHTERMLLAMGADVQAGGTTASIRPAARLDPVRLTVPGDISSAAFLLAAGAIVPGSDILIRHVGLNPTRTGVLDVLGRMGADITLLDHYDAGGEPAGVLRVRASQLRATDIGGDLIPRLIDELPVLAVVATQAEGTTVIRDAAELRVKETDRIDGIVSQLRRLGAVVESRPDGMIVEGPCRLRGAPMAGGGDHRIIMSLLVAGLLAEGETLVDGAEFIDDSYPAFVETLAQLGAEVRGA